MLSFKQRLAYKFSIQEYTNVIKYFLRNPVSSVIYHLGGYKVLVFAYLGICKYIVYINFTVYILSISSQFSKTFFDVRYKHSYLWGVQLGGFYVVAVPRLLSKHTLPSAKNPLVSKHIQYRFSN